MNTPTVAPFGSWQSPITADQVVSASVRLSQLAFDGDDLYWVEQRPAERGRNVIVRRTPDGQITDVNPAPYNARTRAHEYGGGAYTVSAGIVYFSNYDDQRLLRTGANGVQPPQPLTPGQDLRYAEGTVDRGRQRLYLIREDHTRGAEAVNTLVSIDLEGDEERGGVVLSSGGDFFSSPRLSPDGAHLAWLTWNHPNMPWDGCELWVGELGTGGDVRFAQRVAGGRDESIFQPEWSPDGVLHFVSDRTGWWNLYRLRDGRVEPLCPMAAEFGLPQWVFGLSTYAFESAAQIICAYGDRGESHLARLHTTTGRLETITTAFTDIEQLRVMNGHAAFIAGSPDEPPSVVWLDLLTGAQTVLRRSSHAVVEAGYLSRPQPIEFPTEHGLSAHAFYYPPANRDFAAPAGEIPPLLVKAHGGPTGSTSPVLNLGIQFWTSRGFAVLDVNYGGSTGYGREYRRRLNGQWGVVDVDDVVNGARFLVKQRLADPDRLCIDGGSAGGYTTLCALTFRDTFKAGASYYGVSDMEALARDTHKFESRYCDNMIGPYPQRRDIYIARSPIHFVERMATPLILFQGMEDKVVPPSQARLMFEAVRRKGLPVAYIAFEGEQHGFRQERNIRRSLEAESYFYSKVFGFTLADQVEPVDIENLR
jgi:dipeptidyl aminopeptidase/acylaminoacyl peptidase